MTAKWKEHCEEVIEDVVFFFYANLDKEKKAKEIFIWDLDKTYLDTKIDNLKSAVKTFFEDGSVKKNIPGTATLVRALKKGKNDFPFYFVTASPPQLEKNIFRKLQIDGVEPYGIFFKDNFMNLNHKRFLRLTKQVGYKVQALLQMRLRFTDDIRQIFWGDDSETDCIIYSLYSDICKRRLSSAQLEKVLKAFNVSQRQIKIILQLQEKIPVSDPVDKIYINLVDDTDTEYYLKFGRRVIPTFNSFQTALDLFQDSRIEKEQVVQIGQDLIKNYEFTQDELEVSIDDLVRRQILGDEAFQSIFPELRAQGLIHESFQVSMSPSGVKEKHDGRVYALEDNSEPWTPDYIDYLHDYR